LSTARLPFSSAATLKDINTTINTVARLRIRLNGILNIIMNDLSCKPAVDLNEMTPQWTWTMEHPVGLSVNQWDQNISKITMKEVKGIEAISSQ
jgi:hypothetical protein